MKKYLSAPAIVSGIVAALFVLIFIEPLMGGVWKIILLFSDKIYSGYIDYIYASASLGIRNNLDFLIILTIFIVIITVFIELFIAICVAYKELIDLIDNREVVTMPIKTIRTIR